MFCIQRELYQPIIWDVSFLANTLLSISLYTTTSEMYQASACLSHTMCLHQVGSMNITACYHYRCFHSCLYKNCNMGSGGDGFFYSDLHWYYITHPVVNSDNRFICPLIEQTTPKVPNLPNITSLAELPQCHPSMVVGSLRTFEIFILSFKIFCVRKIELNCNCNIVKKWWLKLTEIACIVLAKWI